MNKISIYFNTCSPIPARGYNIIYRIAGSSDEYINAGNFFASPAIFYDTINPYGTCYEGFIRSECHTLLGNNIPFTTCESGSGGPGITTHAIGLRFIDGASYWDNRADACNAKVLSGNCGFGIITGYIRDSDWIPYTLNLPVTLYNDMAGTSIYTDFSLPINATKTRMVYLTDEADCFPNVWQTDTNNFVSLTKETAC